MVGMEAGGRRGLSCVWALGCGGASDAADVDWGMLRGPADADDGGRLCCHGGASQEVRWAGR